MIDNDAERDRRAFDIFAQACTVTTPADRAAVLEQACGGDGELRRRVEQMLDADADADAGQTRPIGSDAEVNDYVARRIRQIHPGVEPALRAESPSLDGEYTILRLIGEGGMGAVYEAEQHQPRRRVAIKAIRPGRITPQMRKRFEYEAQVLARLEHPGIARLYESNTQSEGGCVRAFLAMELVLGEPIDAYVATHELDLDARLRLFMKVCEAVSYAHRMGVIHRDLKPANILVNQEGEPKVLDFGVARTISGGKVDSTQLTHDGQIVGTLAYMSPEQVEGRAEIDTRTDLYALGVILYKLLTGVLPIDVSEANLLVATGKVLEEAPRRIGLRDRRLKGDLEIIVAHTLEKEPGRRYGSVDQLRDEIARYLSGRPIQARGDSTWYWLRKAVWRHRAVVGICLFLVALLTSFGIYAAIQADRNRRLARAADQSRDDALRSEARATDRAAELRRLLYVNNIGFAQSAMENTEVDRARLLLDGCDPGLRDWEWGYLQRLCDLSSATTDLHVNRPRYASFSGDRTRVAIATLDREVALRDNSNGREIMREKLASGTARAAISRDGRWLAYGGVLESITLIDLASDGGAKRELKVALPAELEPTYHFVRLISFTDDCKSVVVAGLDGFLRVWDVPSATVRTKIELGKALPICIEISPTGDWAAVGDNASQLRLFDLHTGKLIRELKGHDAAIWCVALSRDGKRLASGDNGARVMVWDLASGRSIAEQDTNDGWITSVCFSPDGDTVAMGRADSTIRLLHVPDAAPAGVLRGHRHGVISIDWRDDGTLRTISLDGTAKMWNPRAALEVPTINTTLPQAGLVFDRAGSRVFLGGSEGTLRGWTIDAESNDPRPDESARIPAHDDPVMEIAADRSLGRVCTSGRDGVLCISGLNGDAAARVTTSHSGGISSIDLSRDGSRVVASGGGAISMWDASSGAKLGDYSSSKVVANDLSFAADGLSFYAACNDGRVRRWRVGAEQPAADAKVDPSAGVYDVDVSPDGRTVAAGGDTQSLVLLDAQTLQVIRRFVGHQGAVFGVAFHPQGKRLASCGSDRIIRIWDVQTGTELLALRGHRRTIYHLQFSPDGQTLASSSDDGTVKLWRTPSR